MVFIELYDCARWLRLALSRLDQLLQIYRSSSSIIDHRSSRRLGDCPMDLITQENRKAPTNHYHAEILSWCTRQLIVDRLCARASVPRWYRYSDYYDNLPRVL